MNVFLKYIQLKIKDILWLFGLFSLIVASGIAVDYISFLNRGLYNETQKALDIKNSYQVEWSQLLIEYNTLAALPRVEKIAREQLGMIFPNE